MNVNHKKGREDELPDPIGANLTRAYSTRACTESTENCPLIPWQVTHASPSDVVFDNA